MEWPDYLILALMLVLSLAIGLYYSCAGGKQRTTGEYLLGNRQMWLAPVMISTTVSYVSTNTLIGVPSEMYAYGSQYLVAIFGISLAAFLSCIFFVPVFYPLGLTSVNEYILLRYESRYVMYLGTFLSMLDMTVYMGAVLFGPAVALESVSGFSSWAAILVSSAVTIVYTSMGGFKAVIWTDVFQAVVVLAGLVALLIQGIPKIGSFSEVWDINKAWGRLDTFNFNPDPAQRMNFYAVSIGTLFAYAGRYGHHQTCVQRYVSLPTITKAKICLLGTIPGTIILKLLSCATGLVAFAYYNGLIGCDPKLAGKVRSYNQVLPYFVQEIFHDAPGVTGLFLAGCFAASISNVSSQMSSGSAIIWKDVIKPRMPDASDQRGARMAKIAALLMGVVGTLIACLLNVLRGTLLQIGMLMNSLLRGPMGIIFYAGVFMPFVNNTGILLGCLCGVSYGVWLSAGAFTVERNWETLAFNTQNCTTLSFDQAVMPDLAATASSAQLSALQKMYSVSWMWHQDMAAIVTLLSTIIISFLTGYRRCSTIEAKYVHPWVRRLYGQHNFKQPSSDYEKKENVADGSEEELKPLDEDAKPATTSC